MPKERVIYHIVDGAVSMRTAYVDDALAFAEEWSAKPWPGQAETPVVPAPAEEPVEEPVPRRRRGSANNE